MAFEVAGQKQYSTRQVTGAQWTTDSGDDGPSHNVASHTAHAHSTHTALTYTNANIQRPYHH